ncbi:hypothetical protein ABPG74_002668 [Tetrahymena malaccensis]
MCNQNCQCSNNALYYSQCNTCQQGYIYYSGSKFCGLPSSCQSTGSFIYNNMCCTNNCINCNFQNISGTQTCTKCAKKFYQQGNNCIKCNSACNQCTGPTDQDCIKCNQQYFLIDTIINQRCFKCSNKQFVNFTNKYCSNCEYQCLPCNIVQNFYSMINIDTVLTDQQDYCLVCNCSECQSGYIKFNQRQCTDSCNSMGKNLIFNPITKSCQCKTGYNYLMKNPNQNIFECVEKQEEGYYCDSKNVCYKCANNCSICTDEKTCLKCNFENYLWNNNCYKDCFPKLNMVQNKQKGICECAQGYILQQLEYPIDGQSTICQLPLLIEKINMYSCLIQSLEEPLPSGFYNNLIVFQYNRNLTSQEYESFKFFIDQGLIDLGNDYKIVQKMQDGVKIKFSIWSSQNRKIKQFKIQIKEDVVNYQLANQLLVSQEFCQQSSSTYQLQGLNNFMQSTSTLLTPNEKGFYSIIITLLKQFQLLCYISNFVQVLPMLYLIRDSLPNKIKFASQFGSAIVFNQSPPPSQITFVYEEILNSSNQYYLEITLQSLGISKNIFENFILQFLVINYYEREAALNNNNFLYIELSMQLFVIFYNSCGIFIKMQYILFLLSTFVYLVFCLKYSLRSQQLKEADDSNNIKFSSTNRELSSCNTGCACANVATNYPLCTGCQTNLIYYPSVKYCQDPSLCNTPGSTLYSGMCCMYYCQICNYGNPQGNQYCQQCLTGYDLINNNCLQKCQNECTGTTDQDCTLCNQLYFQFDKISKRCQKCPNNQYLKSSDQFCSTCDYQCIPCNSIPFTFSTFQMDSNLIASQDYCLVCSCKQCQDGFIKFNEQQCIASCDLIGSNYVFDSSTNSCQCQPGYKYQIQNPFKNNFDCTQEPSLGYYCNNQNKCLMCNQNCSQCSDSQSCQKCNKGFYLWKNNCIPECFPNLNIVPNENSGECECAQGYIYQYIQTPIQNQFFICQLVLALQEIHIYNKLMQSQDQTLPPNFYANLIVFQYNRELTKEEYQSFQFSIDDGILNQGSDYQIINTVQQKQNIQCTVVSSQNRKIKQFKISVTKSNQNYYVSNAILVSKEYIEQSSDDSNSKKITQQFESMSQTFTQDQNSASGKTISFLKQFQVLCYISNFVQVLPLIYLIRDQLPDNVKFSSLFGVSIIFNKTPPPSQIAISSIDIPTNDYSQKLKSDLQSFGISSNFYENFLQVHLLITISIIIIAYLLVFRVSMKGKHSSTNRKLSSCNTGCACANSASNYPLCTGCQTNLVYYPSAKICQDPSLCNSPGSTLYSGMCCMSYCQICNYGNPQGSQCIKCNAACNQCTGPTDQDCIQCYYLYFHIDPTNSKRCVKCPNNSYLNSSNKNCSNCDYQCIPCSSVDNNYSMLQLDSAVNNNQDYCLVCNCNLCENGYIKFNQKQCTNSCDSIGNNYEYNSSTNSCQCQAGYSYLVKNPYQNNFDCTQGYGFGYYCDSNNICFQCIQNCSNCTDQKSCLKCNNGSYLWQNNCFTDCFPKLNIIPNADKGICECPQGYILQQLNPPIDGQTNICLPALVIQEINIYNYLMQSKGETLPSNFYDNLIVFSYNRNLTSDEYKSINFVIDQGILNFGQDYKILSVSQNGVNVKFIVWSAQNRKTKQFTVTISGQTINYQITNQILVSEEYGKDSQSQFQSQGLTNSLQSMSSAFSPNGDSFNAIVLPIIYLIRDSLPSKIKFACLFGSAIVFNQNPPPSQITFASEQILSSSNEQQLQTTLKSFGISQNDFFKGKAAYQLDNMHTFKFLMQLYTIFNNSNIILHMLLLDEQ